MKIIKLSFQEIVVKSCFVFCLSTVLQGIRGFDAINRIVMAFLACGLILVFLAYKYTTKQFLILALALCIHVTAFIFTEFPLENTNDVFYFGMWILLYVFFMKSKEKVLHIMENSQTYINFYLILWTVIVGISALIPSCYEGSYFVSFTGSSFRLMPATLIICMLSMYMAILTEQKKYNLYLILPLYIMFMGHSRTYFAVMLLFFLCYIYMQIDNKIYFYLALIPVGAIVLGLMMMGGISDKIAESMEKTSAIYDSLGIFTSGRSVFWVWDMEAFFGLPFWQQFVGNGFNFVYDVNGRHMARIWAHNDVINILMTFGYIGLYIYLWAFISMVKAFWKNTPRVPLLVKAMFLFAIFFNSMFNMSYTYICATISYPLFLCVINAKYCSKELGEMRQ